MKKCLLIILVLVTGIIIGCSGNSSQKEAEKLFQKNPVTINWKNNQEKDITSFHTEVEVYSMNNRKKQNFELSNTYSLSVKLIDGVQYTRIDMGNQEGIEARSIITDGNELIVFNPATDEIEMRVPALTDSERALKLFEPGNIGFNKVNLDFVKTQANRLMLDINETDDTQYLCFSLPESLLNSTEYEKQISSKIAFDTVTETLVSVENVSIQPDGTTITSTLSPVYEEYNGELIKIGTIFVVDTQIKELVGELPEDYVVYNSREEMEEITMEELEEMKATGSVFKEDFITFGNPADLSNIETVVELYTDIEINQVKDSEFRMFF